MAQSNPTTVKAGSYYPLFDQAARSNPQAVYAQMRREMPVCPLIGPVSGNTFWIITRYDDCITALKQPQLVKDHTHLSEPFFSRYGGRPEGVWAAINRNMLFVDPPDHTRLRSLVHRAFTPVLIENLRARTQGIADSLIDKVIANNSGHIDLIGDYGFPLPITVIAELLGVPVEDQENFRRWTKALVFFTSEEESMTAAFEFVMYMNNLIDERAAHPKDDLISGLQQAHEAGDKLDREELISMIFLLLVAGHETTVNLIGNGMLSLFQFPDQRALLQQNPHLMRSAVEEMLRFNGPVETATNRFAMENVEIGGVHIPYGDVVLVALHSANRDEAVFENPDRFDITREPNKHIAFGNGIHYCLGAPLARMEGGIAIETLLRRLPSLQPAPGALDHIEWNQSVLLHGMKRLDAAF